MWSAATSISSRLRLGTLYRLRIRAGCRQNGKGTREHGPVRGGSKGHHYDEACGRFDAEQAAAIGMRNE